MGIDVRTPRRGRVVLVFYQNGGPFFCWSGASAESGLSIRKHFGRHNVIEVTFVVTFVSGLEPGGRPRYCVVFFLFADVCHLNHGIASRQYVKIGRSLFDTSGLWPFMYCPF